MSATNSPPPAPSAGTPSLLHRIAQRVRRRPPPADPALQDIATIEASQRFDKQWYLDHYPDVAAAGLDPIEHYVRHGAAAGRNPCAAFDTWFYLTENPDVARAGLNPFRHFVEHGLSEGRESVPPAKRQITGGPLVSIIIPVYAVEEYLAKCLGSVVGQTYRNLEIIIVDDGSPDRSHEIASRFADSDPRIRILRRKNGGLGAARNSGVSVATGRYLTFVDSDDILPAYAIARMVSSLQRTGSDFVVGAIRRLRHGKLMPPDAWVKEIHAENQAALHLRDFPEILTDVLACNKLFCTDFFRNHVGSFPEGIRYEDHEPSARAYLKGVFDVLTDTVYHWRIRADGTSITQSKSDLNDLRDRLTVKQRVSHILAETDTSTYETWLARALGLDLRPYFNEVPRTDVNFFHLLREGMLSLAKQMTPQLWQQVRMIDRLPALAVLAGHRDDVGIAITRRKECGYFVPGRLDDGSAYLDRAYLEGMKLSPDDDLLKLGDADLTVVAVATSLWWHGTRLHLEGYAYLANLTFDDDAWISGRLVSDNRPPVALTLEPRHCSRIDHETTDAWNSHAKSGFAIDVNPTELGLDATCRWRLELTVGCAGLKQSYRAFLRDADTRGIIGTPAVSAMSGRFRWIAAFEPGRGFVLWCHRSRYAFVTSLDTAGGIVAITVDQSDAETLLLTCVALRGKMEVLGNRVGVEGTAFRFELPQLPDGDKHEHVWHLHLCGQGDPQRLVYHGDRDSLERESPEHHRIRALMNRHGTLWLRQASWWAVADEVNVGLDAITVRGRIDAPRASALTARLVGDTQMLEADQVEFDPIAQRFEVRIPFDPGDSTIEQATSSTTSLASSDEGERAQRVDAEDTNHTLETLQPTMLHGFSLRLSVVLQNKRSERWLRVANGLLHQLPADRSASRYRLTFTRTPRAGALWVRFRAPYRENKRGCFGA